MASEIGGRVREARELAGISARELDRLAELTEGHVSLIESHTNDVKASTLTDLARVLGVSLDWLIVGAGLTPSAEVVRAAVEEARARRVLLQKTGTEA